MTHSINEPWRSHIKDAIASVNEKSQNIALLKSAIYDNQQEQLTMQTHIKYIVGQIAKEANLPTPYEQYSLSADGTAIIGKDTPNA